MEQFEAALETVNPVLRLPQKNDYIASKFDLKARETVKREYPHVIQDDAWCRIWFKQDDEYKLPIAVTRVALISPAVMKSLQSQVLLKIFSACLQDALTEDVSNAELAGVSCNISEKDFGLLLEVMGYDEKQPQLVEHIIKRMIDFKPDPLRFDDLFDGVKRSFKNFVVSEPTTLSEYYVELLLKNEWTMEQAIAIFKGKRSFCEVPGISARSPMIWLNSFRS
ncbi:hypothetical protein COOONC_01430 [Cooperia oncophora]